MTTGGTRTGRDDRGGDAIPVIDISPAVGVAAGDLAGRADAVAAAQAVDAACRNLGFLTIVGHAVPETLRREVLEQAERFFALPPSEKERCAIERSPNHRGYGRIAAEHLQPDIPSDLKETFDVGIECPADDPDRCPLEGPNQWPDLEGFRPVLEEYLDRAVDTVRTVLRLIALGRGLSPDHFDACHERPIVTARLLHYPDAACRDTPEQLGAGAHSDYGSLTLLFSDGTPGLQVLGPDDRWIDVDIPAGGFVVNLGDMLQTWTNDLYRSTLHRVLPPVGRDRYSVPVFVNPEWSTPVEALPGCVTGERPARHPPTLAGPYLERRLSETFVYRQTTTT